MVGVTHSNLGMSMPDIRLDLHTTVRPRSFPPLYPTERTGKEKCTHICSSRTNQSTDQSLPNTTQHTKPQPTQIDGVKEKLYTHCGTKPHHQRLVLRHSTGETVRVGLGWDAF